MKSLVSLLVILALILTVVLPTRLQAQDDVFDAQARVQAIVDAVWDASANFRAHIESTHNVTLTKDHGMRTLQAIYPKTMKYVEEYGQRRWGIEIIELDGGRVRITTSRPLFKGGAEKDGGISYTAVMAALGFVWLALNLYQLGDDMVEDKLVSECLAEGNPLAGCQEDANALTDNLRYLAYPVPPCFGSSKFCLPQMLNEMERAREHRPRHEPLNQLGQPRTPPPAGMTPQEVGRYPCPGGSNHEIQTPIAPQSPPGSNDTHGSFDGTITVTTSPPACT
jgi:hypothetical protein